MKELKEFTVERLKSLSQEPDVLSLHAYEIMALAKIALAAKQAKPIGEVRLSDYDSDGCRQGSVTCLHDQADWDNFPDGTKLYATPPLNHTDHHLDMVVPDGFTEIQLIKAMTWINRVRAENPNMKEARTCADLILRVLPAAPKPEM